MERAKAFFFALAATCGLLLGGGAAAASDLVFLLDGSGSMWGRAGTEVKILEARRVMADLLADLPPGVDLGLVAYGHRRKGDCTDVETLAALGTPASAIAERVETVTPLGKTPITGALEQGAELLAGRPGRRTLVLVSDGIETCAGDPCALAERLHAEDIELVIHTVGFDVGADAQRQLRCIAEKGGGRYYHAADGEALRRALLGLRDAAAHSEPPPPPPAPPELPEVETAAGRVVVAGPGTLLLKPAPWIDMPPYRWRVLDAESGEVVGTSKSDRLRVPPGEYRLVWRQTQNHHTDVPLTEVVSVASRQTVEVPIDTGLRLTVPEGIAPPYRWSLREIGASMAERPTQRRLDTSRGDAAVFKGTIDPQVVPAGIYRLLWWQDESLASALELGPVFITAGRLNEHVLASGLVVRGADWLEGEPYRYLLLGAGNRAMGHWKRFGPQLAPPGRWILTYRHDESAYPQDVGWTTVEIPENGFATVAIDSGVRFVTAPDTPLPYKVVFVPLDREDGAEIEWKGKFAGSWSPVPLPPGRYRLDWWEDEHRTERMTLIEEFEVPESTLVEVEL